ncbi:hypothetical protein LILPAPAWES_5 [Morganella phage vB_MmoP_Lilpapawes]|uniref:Uncharacterized protein n=1 Tax=Morganella phage vB_MmoP_Lilpapawes TaxID=2894803 RepID=A0AAE8YP37_9CAUD|nr:hypothetical protein LILPAPAWES_5 [Morganella phage vB_MmoP_Lilpapawes]
MKLNRLRKNMVYVMCYSGTFKRFRKNLRKSPDKGLSRIPARKVKAEWLSTYRAIFHDSSCCGLEHYAKLLGADLKDKQSKEALKTITFGLRYGAERSQAAVATFKHLYGKSNRG